MTDLTDKVQAFVIGGGGDCAMTYTPTDILHAEIKRLEDELMSVRADAAASIYFWGQFASPYSKVHHELDADITRLRGPVPIDVVLHHPQAPVLPEDRTAEPLRIAQPAVARRQV